MAPRDGPAADVFDSLEPIPDRDVSIIVQGPLFRDRDEGIHRCLTSLRTILPDSEIIISSWLGEDAGGLDADHVVLSTDPGCFWESPTRPYNLNRLLVSTAAGLRRASRKYSLKIRSDMAMTHRRFLCIGTHRQQSHFSRPVTIPNLYVRDPERFPLLFHVADTAQFGLTSDLLAYWQGDPFLRNEVLSEGNGRARFSSTTRLFPEQALTTRWLQRNDADPGMRHASAISPRLLREWSTILTQNFSVCDWKSSGLVFPARLASDPTTISTLLSSDRFARLDVQQFSYLKSLRAKYFSLTYLVHARLGPLVSTLQANLPKTHEFLRGIWIRLLKARS